MVAKITFDQLTEKIPNKYELAIIVGNRARSLGGHIVINSKAGLKETTLQKCFKEILEGELIVSDAQEMEREKLMLEELSENDEN